MLRNQSEISKELLSLLRERYAFTDKAVLSAIADCVAKDEPDGDCFLIAYPDFRFYWDYEKRLLWGTVSWYFSYSFREYPNCRTTIPQFYPYKPSPDSPEILLEMKILADCQLALVTLPVLAGGGNTDCPKYLVCLASELESLQKSLVQKISEAFKDATIVAA